MEAGQSGFRGIPWLPGADLQTIVPALWPDSRRARPVRLRYFPVEAGTRVGIEIDRPRGTARGTLLLAHGMGGSARSAYMLDTAAHATLRGWLVLRMNLRNCGGTERQARTLYNAGQSRDVGAVLEALDADDEFPRPFAVAGFSMGGNIVLRYAGLAGAAALADRFVGVNAPVELEGCLRALERPRNLPYHLHFVWRLCGQMRTIRRVRDVPGPPASVRAIRTLRRFDNVFTAPDAGYPSAEDYYAAASSAPSLTRIRRPTLIVSAANDPFVPVEMYAPHRGNRAVRFCHPSIGGHCGYWQRDEPRFWIAETIARFLDELPRPG